MRRWKDPHSPYNKIRLSFEASEIDDICENALKQENLLPQVPEPIRIDRFVEKYFKIGGVCYEDLGPNHLGYTCFSRQGQVLKVAVNESLCADEETVSLRRERSTIAHEAGHGLLHPSLFIAEDETLLAVKQHLDAADKEASPQIMCRKEDIQAASSSEKSYNGKWWEWQANRAIGGLLLPRKLVRASVDPFLTPSKSGALMELVGQGRVKAIDCVSEKFDVNPAVARIRLQEMYPLPDKNSLF